MPRRSPHHLHRQKLISPLINLDWPTLGLIILLSIIGLLMVFNASNVDAYYQFSDATHFFKLQGMWLIASLFSLLLTSIIPLAWLRRSSLVIFGVVFVLLIAVLIPGIGREIMGARRWLYLGPMSLQPSELIKLAVAIYLPAFLIKHQRPLPFSLITFTLLGLLMLEPDLGTSLIVLSISFFTYFLAGAKMKHLLAIIGVALVLGSMLVSTSSYRLNRVKTFFNLQHDPQGASYHMRQVIISLGSGGLTGSGIGRSRQKYQYLPEASTDSIFAVIAEEVGFLGSGLLIGLMAFTYLRAFQQISHINETYPRLVAGAVISWLVSQTTINLAAMVAIIPLTGVPLPFISYGGSSLLSAYTAIGLYLNASRYRNSQKTR